MHSFVLGIILFEFIKLCFKLFAFVQLMQLCTKCACFLSRSKIRQKLIGGASRANRGYMLFHGPAPHCIVGPSDTFHMAFLGTF